MTYSKCKYTFYVLADYDQFCQFSPSLHCSNTKAILQESYGVGEDRLYCKD